MGLAASQARLLSLTARIHDVEYQAQMIQAAKLQLATLEDEVYRKYNEALDATTLTYKSGDNLIPANFNNLCGIASIDNGMNTNFVFRTGNDKTQLSDCLILPDEIYEGFQNYKGSDPYEFALFMLGVDVDDVRSAENELVEKDGSDNLKQLREAYRGKIGEIAKAAGYSDDDIERTVETIVEGGSIEGIPGEEHCDEEPFKKLISEFKDIEKEYRYKLYNKNNGVDTIYQKATNSNDNVDYAKYNYYLRWGMLIKQDDIFADEFGLQGAVKQSDYGQEFGNDSNTLQEMLQTGRIIIETVEFDGKGGVNDSTTSVASDSTLDYTTTSSIDKKELAKAEAEYEHAMKQIDKKDKRFDMDLNRLETERTALTTEYDSVKKVIQDNIERTFGIFS